MPQTFSVLGVPGSFARLRGWYVAPLAGLALSLGFVTRVPAATTWTVCTSGCQYTSIRAAIAATTTVDGDTLAITAGTYTEAGITINKSLTLQGEAAATTIVQAVPSQDLIGDRVFRIPSGVTVAIQALTVRYGAAYDFGGDLPPKAGWGGGLFNQGTLILTHSTISGNHADVGGRLANEGVLTLINSTISGNSAYRGGGLANQGVLTLINSTISGNSAMEGGGLFNSRTLTITHGTITGNSASPGGGLYNYSGTLTLTHSIVSSSDGDCYNNSSLGSSIISKGYNLDNDRSCYLTAATDRVWTRCSDPCRRTAAPPAPMPCCPAAPRLMLFPLATMAAAPP
jgi:hypothetical protein